MSKEPIKPIYQQITPHAETTNRLAKRILEFDPTPVYGRIEVNPFKRFQKNITHGQMFPNRPDNTCACGCGRYLTGRRTRWATSECGWFASAVYEIICGYTRTIRKYVLNETHRCESCGTNYWEEIDHIVPVCRGGGGCWLNNYQKLCSSCHKAKTKLDVR